MNADLISYEYFLKARQLTWENAEFIDKFFGPVISKMKSSREEKRCLTSYENGSKVDQDHKLLMIKQRFQQDNWNMNGNLYVHLDYKKVTNVRVLISMLDFREKNSSSGESSKQPPVRSESTYSSKAARLASPSRSQGDDDNACAICHKKFKYKKYLTAHLLTHIGEKPFSCPQCEKKFARKGDLKRHLLIHSGTKQFSCDICYKTFWDRGNFKAHRRTHTGDKPFECTTCNAMFSRKGNLDVHMRTHTGETPYQCETCEKKFSNRTGLKSHILTHTQEKLHACTHANCRKTFRSKSDLQRHSVVHTGAKPYSCPNCHQKFNESGNCKRHANRCPVTRNDVV